MNKKSLCKKWCLLLVASLFANASFAQDWLEGVYINQDKDSLMEEVIFCQGGKAYAGMSPRKYEMTAKNDEKLVVLKSNGVFTFKVSADNKELFPVDDFTKNWFTEKTLLLDSNRTDTCK
ncbi:hypothetical protein [Salinivibrio sp. HTSP]|uniref:hypothetical protein n=1 Tax=Salinivibrio sp. HTSP TaxID=2115977 RepID=UPI000E30F620|nr:hypothetical protein [Salinivibrio sp. HTSP]